VRVEHVLLENIVTIVNLGMRRTGLMPGTEDERDLVQVQLAIEAVRALLPQIEQVAPQQVVPIRDALSQLQMGFVQASGGQPQGPGASSPAEGGSVGGGSVGGGAVGGEPETPPAPTPGEAGPAQRSGRLWVPGEP
jgi:hypothetical protein